MSQIWKSSESTPPPPSVATSFTTDTSDNFAFNPGSGTSVTTNNNFSLLGDNGIQTSANTIDPSVIQIRYDTGTASTLSDETTIPLAFVTTNDTCLTFQVLVSGFCPSLSVGVGGWMNVTIQNSGGVGTILNVDTTVTADPLIGDASFSASITFGNIFNIDVTGSLGNPIDWVVVTPGIISS